jgi:hypothetical protein
MKLTRLLRFIEFQNAVHVEPQAYVRQKYGDDSVQQRLLPQLDSVRTRCVLLGIVSTYEA